MKVIFAFKSRPGILKELIEDCKLKDVVKIKIPHGIYQDTCYWNKINVNYILVRNRYMEQLFKRRGNVENTILIGDENKKNNKYKDDNNINQLLVFTRPIDSLKLSEPIYMYYYKFFIYVCEQVNNLKLDRLVIKCHPREDKNYIKSIIENIDSRVEVIFIENCKLEEYIVKSDYIFSVKSSILFELLKYGKKINIADFWNEDKFCNIEQEEVINVVSKYKDKLVKSVYIKDYFNSYHTDTNIEKIKYIQDKINIIT